MRLRRLLAGLAVAGVFVIAGGAPAYAVDPPPPPLDPVYDVPSTWQGGVLTEEQAALRKHEIDLARRADSAKIWTRPVNLTTWKGLGGAAGWGAVGFGVGWQLGASSLEVYAAAHANDPTGEAAAELFCSTPDWYRGSSLVHEYAPLVDCSPYVAYGTPNTDQPTTSVVTWNGTTYPLLGYRTVGSPVTFKSPCLGGNMAGIGNGTAPITWAMKRADTGLWTSYNAFGPTSLNDCRSAGFASTTAALGDVLTTYTTWGIRRASDGAILAEAETTHADPTRNTRCTYWFADGSSVSSSWVPYKDSTGWPATEWGEACNDTGATLTDAQRAQLRSVGVETREGSSGTITEIAESEVPTEMQQYQEDMVERGGTGRGALLLMKTLETGAEISCLSDASLCRDWWEETTGGTETSGTPYRCMSGSVVVNIAECAVYRYSFSTKPGTISDPVTGEDVEWGQGENQNSLDPSTGPGTGSNPAGQCFDDGYSSVQNPVDWVLVPVKCALVWAFVPRLSKVEDGMEAANARWSETLPGKLPALVLGAMTPPAGVSGCEGPHVAFTLSLPFTGLSVPYDGYPLSACVEPMASVASLARTIGSAVLIFFTALGIIRRGSAVVGAPGVGGGPA